MYTCMSKHKLSVNDGLWWQMLYWKEIILYAKQQWRNLILIFRWSMRLPQPIWHIFGEVRPLQHISSMLWLDFWLVFDVILRLQQAKVISGKQKRTQEKKEREANQTTIDIDRRRRRRRRNGSSSRYLTFSTYLSTKQVTNLYAM